MPLILHPSQAPNYNGDSLPELQTRNINIKSQESINGLIALPTKVDFDFTFYGRTPNNNRIYNKTANQVFDQCTIPDFMAYAHEEAANGNMNAVLALLYLQKTIGDIVVKQKPQYSTLTYQES